MSLELPVAIEPLIENFAKSENISSDEALLRLVQIGLKEVRQRAVSPFDIIGAFKDEPEHLTDEALEVAMQERERRNSLMIDV